MRFARLALVGAVLCVAGPATPASAELVYLTSGRTMSVKSHAEQGDLIVLRLRGGGEASFDRALVERIEPDEVPYPDPPTPKPGSVIPAEGRPLGDVPYGELI